MQLADSLADISGVDVTLISQGLTNDLTVHSKSEFIDRHVYESSSRVSLRFGLQIRKELERIMLHQTPSLLHSHGLWLPVNYWAARAARRYNIPLVIHPRGMLEPWALSNKVWKKRLAMLLFQRRDLESATLLIATSLDEYQNIRNLGFSQPVAIIPNGIQLDTVNKGVLPPNRKSKERTALFLSRIHPKKGLLNLITAWGQLRPTNWRLRIVGPNEGGHLAEVIAAASANGIEDVVDFVDEVDDESKKAVYQNADLFVLPTFSENFGVVVAEALAHGLPVITTRGAPWSDLETYG
ncbi:MAG: glycosyltransferase, partial [Desulfobacteraceae bacterium]|nr:glycosyltransferase [Desulfobacteraceae bacterium]